ncbi:hypothetical protein [Mesorhizobium sp.]|uniref:hypothetical protein n=1 Tax=Mesorhizobium sp. TaxID=1871066 RepID=UPI000FE6D56B|nr:hypothetical protein [Mesorhizobium sp.]RWJ00173.1 MAG: hypothetical protein EOR23_30530 [Mesorhizobium sp.]TIR30195.1 MAG: hypothetical protein E5X35_23125 [Mesorhizobium sp.]
MIQYESREAAGDQEMAELRAMATSPQSRAAIIAKRICRDARSIAEVMSEIHGGEWSVDIDHDDCFVLISRDLLPT